MQFVSNLPQWISGWETPRGLPGLGDLPPPVRVLITSPSESVRTQVTRTIQAIPTRLSLAGTTSTAPEAVRAARRLQPDAVIVDVSVTRQGVGLLTLVPALIEACTAKVVLLAGDSDRPHMAEAFRVGASSVAWKAASPVALVGAINTAVYGQPRGAQCGR
jgi:DNA-binding NarL/FixJ family response regulator